MLRGCFWVKTGFFRCFSEAKSHHVGEFGSEVFPQALISNELKIICKVSENIYTPGGYRGEGVPLRGGTDRGDV
jgi:hypothetical protein